MLATKFMTIYYSEQNRPDRQIAVCKRSFIHSIISTRGRSRGQNCCRQPGIEYTSLRGSRRDWPSSGKVRGVTGIVIKILHESTKKPIIYVIV